MARNKNLKQKVHIGVLMPRATYEAFKGLAKENDVSLKFVLRRLIENSIHTRVIPWPGNVPPKVLTYDAEPTNVKDGRILPVPPAQ